MASNFTVNIANGPTGFSCQSCSTFADYVNKVNITKYDGSTSVDIADIVTQNDLNSTALTNTNAYYDKYTKNNTTVWRGVMKTNLNICGGWAGYVDLPYYQGGNQISPVLAGTVPKFSLKHTITSGSQSLRYVNGKLKCGDTVINAEDSNHTPLRVLIVMQAGGGGGGGSTYHNLGTGWWGGSGGGGGGAAAVLVDVAAGDTWTLSVGSGGSGGAGGYTSTSGITSSDGSRGGATKISYGSHYVECKGGGGGGSFSNIIDAYAGGSGGDVSYTSEGHFSVLATRTGIQGASSNSSGAANMSAWSASNGSTIFNNSTYSTVARTGGSNKQAGGPSAHGDAGSNGGGGNGGAGAIWTANDGGAGGNGFIKIYY